MGTIGSGASGMREPRKAGFSLRCVKCELTAKAPSGDPKEVNMAHSGVETENVVLERKS